jgi:hypothetical protein
MPASQPPLGGNATITVSDTMTGISSVSLPFYYSSPSVTSMTPTIVPVIGGTNITITGINFGLKAVLYVGGVNYPIRAQSHTRIIFSSPAGLGTNISVVVAVAGTNATRVLSYRYANPIITSITPSNGTTQGGYSVVISGSNFGTDALGALTVTLPSWGPCIVTTRVDASITCTLPAGQGLSQSVNLIVGSNGQTVSALFHYNAPNITRVYGCVQGDAVSTSDCPPTSTNQTITILGSNFGIDITGLKVMIGSAACTSLSYGYPTHNNISCVIPSGYGRKLLVTVSRGVQSSPSRPWLSYQGPELVTGSLHMVGFSPILDAANNGVANLSVETTSGGDAIGMTGTFIGVNPLIVEVFYGPPSSPFLYQCINVRNMVNGSLECTTTAGIGKNLQFTVVVAGISSNPGSDLFHYPPPIITPATIRFAGRSPSTFIVSNTTQGDLIAFDGLYFGSSIAEISVTYGSQQRQCSVTNATTTNTIYCYTQPGQGLELNFTVNVGTGVALQTAYGSDTYSYALPPVILSVEGCYVTTSGRTSSCPTSGIDGDGSIVLLTVTGDKFYGEITSVTVGGKACLGLQFNGQDEFTCQLPIGAGVDRLVVVDRGLSFSEGVPYVSYMYPTISTISGCDYINDDRTGNCNRQGGTWITLTGENFGASNAKVFVGGQACTNVTHDIDTPHTLATCILPPGVGYGNAVLLFQDGGELTPDALFVDYTPCSPGTYVYPAGSTSCDVCGKGSFAALSAQSACEACAAGSFSSQTALTECSQCQTGRYQSNTGSLTCDPCTTGRYASSGRPSTL